MSRFLFLFAFVFIVFGAQAAEKLSPPISGDMTKTTPYETPVVIPSVILSSESKGLTYLSEYKTKLIVVNIWASWCPPCISELPSLNALQHAMGGNLFDVVTVSLDTTGLDVVKKFLVDNKLDALPAYVDVNEDLQKLSVMKDVPGIPISLIIDPQMRVLAKVEGDVDWNGPAARAVLEYYAKKVSYSPL